VKRIALVVFGDPTELPPTLNLAHVLHRRGWEVDLIGIRWRDQSGFGDGYPEGVPVLTALESGAGLMQARDHLRFALFCARRARARRYDWIYAFDLPGAAPGAIMARVGGAHFAYHLHDLAPPGTLSPVQRLLILKTREHRAARRADLVVLPQPERARLFAAEARLQREPVVALNCPPLEWPAREAPPPPALVDFARRWPKLVVYQGGLTRARGLAALLDSLPHWPAGSALVLVGDPRRYRDAAELMQRSPERVLWLGPVPYGALPSVTRAARLGILLTPGVAEDINLRYLAGASNKVFEYLACGLPMLVPDTRGFHELIEAPGHGRICRDLSPRALAAQIAELLDDRVYAETSTRNRQAFRETYHYERQLVPVLETLES
jgi:glycosyltransferase involved in cell wall biosynthesis